MKSSTNNDELIGRDTVRRGHDLDYLTISNVLHKSSCERELDIDTVLSLFLESIRMVVREVNNLLIHVKITLKYLGKW